MQPRFVPRGSVPEYVGVSDLALAETGTDTTPSQFPSSDDGTIADGTTYEDLRTGERWYYAGGKWLQSQTPTDRLRIAVEMLRAELKEANRVNANLAEQMRDLLLKIA